MKRLGLFYFSGTGNTKLVAGHITEEFQQMGWEVTVVNIEQITKKTEIPDISGFDLIGMGAQVIGYTIPRRFRQFVKMLPRSVKKNRVFIFRTCGGVAETNYTASHSLIHILRKKNYDVFYERLFSIGSNWVTKFDNEIMKQLYDATKRKIVLMCRDVVDGKERFYKTSLSLRLKKKFISVQSSIVFKFMGKNMKVESSCVKCGLCVKGCPGKNIRIVDDKIKFSTNCSTCLRCVYNCPKKAIKFKRFKFIPLKNGYDVNKVLFQDTMEAEETNGRIPPFFTKYVSDDKI